MKRESVESSNIASVGFEPGAGLEIEFRNGRIYRYPAVPREIFLGLIKAKSKGGFFAGKIRLQFNGVPVPLTVE
jgi:hypothetical protein